MWLVSEAFLTSTHGQLGCIACHGGENVPDKQAAHDGMLVHPSSDFDATCGECHGGIAENFSTSIHYTLSGFTNSMIEFTNFTELSESPHLEGILEEDCFKCHATCGDCHVSRPGNWSRGLIDEHTFFGTPPMDQTCYGCHNARNAGEYMGTVGFGSDVHYQKGMDCMDCHPVSNFHGTGELSYNFWDVDLPSCLDCHSDKDPATTTDFTHKVHGDSLSCQVCHAQANNNCFECHVSVDEAGHASTSSQMRIMFRIGYNPEITEERPYKYVVLRHVPTQEGTFDELAEGLLPNFHDKPNWNYSPTHNIQKSTFQNESCEACHDNTRIWLRPEDLRDSDSKANELLIPALPPKLDH